MSLNVLFSYIRNKNAQLGRLGRLLSKINCFHGINDWFTLRPKTTLDILRLVLKCNKPFFSKYVVSLFYANIRCKRLDQRFDNSVKRISA